MTKDRLEIKLGFRGTKPQMGVDDPIWRKFIYEKLQADFFSVAVNDHSITATKDMVGRVSNGGVWPELKHIGELPAGMELCEISYLFRDMVIARSSKPFTATEHGFRSGRTQKFHEGLLFVIECCPRDKEVLVRLWNIPFRVPPEMHFLHASQILRSHRIACNSNGGDHGTDPSSRTKPENRDFTRNAIERAFLKLGRASGI